MRLELPVSPFLYPILDAEFSTNLLVDAQNIIRAGVKILQIRAKKEIKRRIFEIAKEVAALCAENNVCCIVNDCVDVALIADVSGVHLGQEDFPLREARRLLADKLIGVSTHNAEQFAVANREPVDYIAIGPVYLTSTKMKADPAIGFSSVTSIIQTKMKPVIAIGGIRLEHIDLILRANIDGIAMISELYREGKLYDNVSQLMEKFRLYEQI